MMLCLLLVSQVEENLKLFLCQFFLLYVNLERNNGSQNLEEKVRNESIL